MNIDLEKYILEHIDAEDSVLHELDRYTHINVLRPRMLSGHLQGSILKMICRMIQPQLALEIGSFTGYSAISMIKGMPTTAHLHTIEVNDELESTLKSFFAKAEVENQLTLHIGKALEVIPTLPNNFDLIFIDGDKREYPQYYEAVFNKLNPGGFIVADNVLWGGKVTEPNMPDDAYTKGIMDFNQLVAQDKRVEKVILPLRDGLTLIRKKQNILNP